MQCKRRRRRVLDLARERTIPTTSHPKRHLPEEVPHDHRDRRNFICGTPHRTLRSKSLVAEASRAPQLTRAARQRRLAMGSPIYLADTRGQWMMLLRSVSPRLVAVIYTGGTLAHIYRLTVRFGWRDMPFFVDWLLVVLGPIGVVGLLALVDEISYRGPWERVTHWLILLHLSTSVVVHIWILALHSHEVLKVFPYGYSYFAAAYFAFFGWRSWTLRLKDPAAGGDAAAQAGEL